MATGLKVNRLTNCNAYVDGANWFGKAAEVTLPTLKTLLKDHQALGMVGMIELPSGLDKLDAKFKWNSWYPDVLAKSANPYKSVNIQIRCSVETYEAGGLIAETGAVCFMRGTFKDANLGNFKQHDNVDLGTDMNITYVRLEYGGKVLINIDVLANIWEVDGVDIRAKYRDNLGI